MSKQEPTNGLPQIGQSSQEYSQTDQTGSILTLSIYQNSINESISSQIKAQEYNIERLQITKERQTALRQMFQQKEKQGSESSKLKRANEQITRLNEIIESIQAQLHSYQLNSDSLKRENRELLAQKHNLQRLQKINKEMNTKYDHFEAQLQLIIKRQQQQQQTSSQNEKPNKQPSQDSIEYLKEIQSHLENSIQELGQDQATQSISNHLTHKETNQKLQILFESMKDLQTQFQKRTEYFATQCSSKHSRVIELQSLVKRLEQANNQLSHKLAAILPANQQQNQQLGQKCEIINKKDAQIAQLRDNIARLSQANAKLQSQSVSLIMKNYESFQILNQQLKQQNNRLTDTISKITNQKKLLAVQLLQQKQNSFLQLQMNSEVLSQRQALQVEIAQLNTNLKFKEEQINNIQIAYESSVQQFTKVMSQLIQINEQKYECISKEHQQFYTGLLLKRQDNWGKIRMMLMRQIELRQFIAQKHTQKEIQFDVRQANSIKADQMQLQKVQHQFKQLLALSESQILNISKQLDSKRWQLQNIRQSQSETKKYSQRYREVLKNIENYSTLSELINKLDMLNEHKELDGVVLAFTAIQDLISNIRIQNSQLLSNIDKKSVQIELLKNQMNQKDKEISIIKQKLNEASKERTICSNNLLQKNQEYDQQMLELKHKLEQSENSQSQLSEQYSLLVKKNKQLEQNIASIQAKQFEINKDIQSNENSQISELKDRIVTHHQTIDHFRKTIQDITKSQKRAKQENKELAQINAQLVQDNDILKKSKQALAKYQKEWQNLSRQNKQLKKKVEQSKGSEQLQMNSSYQQLYQTAKQQKDLIEAQLNDIKAKYDKLKNNRQLSKNIINKPIQAKEPQSNYSNLNSSFMMSSLIDNYPKGREFVISVIEKFSGRQVQQIQMIFKMDDNNKTTFHNTFKATDLNEGVYAYLFKKNNNAFGFLTFYQKIKGVPSAVMFSVNNNLCIFKDDQKYQATAFKYDFNTIYFGNNEAKIKSGSKFFSASDGGGYRKYFGKYSKAQIFGEDFKESLQIQQFEIHKVMI